MHVTPLVQNNLLILHQAGEPETILVDSHRWYDWLMAHQLFAFQSDLGKFTARKEPYQRGGEYWKAYRKRAGKLYRIYLGKSENLNHDYLRAVAQLLTERLSSITPEAPELNPQRGKPALSQREQEILCLVEYGMANKEIAAYLIITLNTVKEHLKHIYAKLDVQSRTSAVNRARTMGLLEV